jgi:hypothetical protein
MIVSILEGKPIDLPLPELPPPEYSFKCLLRADTIQGYVTTIPSTIRRILTR